jgi:hypothetical protein
MAKELAERPDGQLNGGWFLARRKVIGVRVSQVRSTQLIDRQISCDGADPEPSRQELRHESPIFGLALRGAEPAHVVINPVDGNDGPA